MLDSGMGSAMNSAMESAAEARLSKIKTQMNIPEPEAQRSVVQRVLGLVANTILLGAAGSSLAAGYYSWAYDAKELKAIVEQTKTQEANAFPGSDLWVRVMERYLEIRQNIETQIKVGHWGRGGVGGGAW